MCPATLDMTAGVAVERAIAKGQAKRLPSILVVDDDALVRKIFYRILDEGGYPTVTVGGGREAMPALRSGNFDVLVLDLCMPEQDGLQVLGLVRSEFPDLKILVVSGFLRGGMLHTVRRLGADATLHKASAVDSLLPTIGELLRHSTKDTLPPDRPDWQNV